MDISDAIATALHTMKIVNGATVFYRRGNQAVEVVAVRGQSQQQGLTNEGLEFNWQSHDWTFHADELLLAGNEITPTRGDEIHETIGGKTRVYAVTHQNPNTQPYAFEDLRGRVLRVFTLHKSTT